MSQTITLEGPTRSMRRLHDAYEFGQSGRLGLTDAATTAAHHMGGMFTQMRDLHEARVAELRARNLAEAEESREAGDE